MIRIGPAGIPLSSKGRTILDGIQYTHELGLNTMEVQFVRGITIDDQYAVECGNDAEERKIPLTVHAPYYTNLATDSDKTLENTTRKIAEAGKTARLMGGSLVVVNPGFYTSHGKDDTREIVAERLQEVRDTYDEEDLEATLGLKTMGKQKTFGTLEEVLDVCDEIDGVVPILNFGNLHARSNGRFDDIEDFAEVFEAADRDHYHCQFSGVQYENGNLVNTIPIKKSDIPLDPLIDYVLDEDLDITIISDSPIVEHDAMYIKINLERAVEKRELDMDEVFPPPAVIPEEEQEDDD